jgi:SnoaL-like domain
VEGQPASAQDIGSVAFDVADRLAIINLFGAYAYTYDENRLDEFRALFTDSPELVLLHEGATLSADIDTVMSLLAVRKGAFRDENNQRRHALNSFWFSSQSAVEATGRCYVQVFAIKDGGPPTPDLTGCYEFTAVKQHGVWRFSRWKVAIDQTNLGKAE